MGAKSEISDFQQRFNVSRETLERLNLYESLLKKWNPAINLVSASTLPQVWTRHFTDSAQLWQLRPASAALWLDLGSGGGFPGLVIAAIAAEQAPKMRVGLVESDARKASFLAQAGREMEISPEIHITRAESLPRQGADIVSARALAPLDKLLGLAHRHLSGAGICLFPKGKNSASELTRARKYWTFETEETPSVTDPGGKILKIGGLGRVSPQ